MLGGRQIFCPQDTAAAHRRPVHRQFLHQIWLPTLSCDCPSLTWLPDQVQESVARLKRKNGCKRLRSIGIEAEQATHSNSRVSEFRSSTAEYQRRKMLQDQNAASSSALLCGKWSSILQLLWALLLIIISARRKLIFCCSLPEMKNCVN